MRTPQRNWFIRILNRIRGRDPLQEYYAWLLQFGRVTEGRVIDLQQDEQETTLYYCYNVANVLYETSQKLTVNSPSPQRSYIPGASITVRYDPHNPGSSCVP